MRGTLSTVALWDAEEQDAPAVHQMTVATATPNNVRQFVARYHYSRAAGTTVWNYGLWHGPTLWGIATLNLPTRTVCESVFGAEHWASVHHLSRLAVADHAPRNSESRLIAGTLKLHRTAHPEARAVLSYADPLEGHIGYIYQATNALYCGLSSSRERRYITADGRVRGTYCHGRLSATDAMARGWQIIEGKPKHRYVYLLGNKTERRWARATLKWPVLPYPKGDA